MCGVLAKKIGFDASHFPHDAKERSGVVAMSYETASPPEPTERRILRRPAVERKTGMSRAHIYTLMREGKFPKALRIGTRAVGWDSVELDQWIAERRQERT
jgi:prophage regulatory protein